MQVGAVMRRCAHQAQRTTPIVAIARMMGDEGARTVAVSDGGRFVGLVTDWDISCRLVISGGEIASATAADVMDAAQLSCGADMDLDEALAMMNRAGARCVAITDARKHLLGMLHRDDVPPSAA